MKDNLKIFIVEYFSNPRSDLLLYIKLKSRGSNLYRKLLKVKKPPMEDDLKTKKVKQLKNK
jgi:hypothetical protein